MHRHLHKWHRRIGAFGALIAIYLAVTGLLLNHTHDLGLDSTHTRSSLMLKLYNIKPQTGRTVETGRQTISQLGETLFIGNILVTQDGQPMTGATRYSDMYLVTTLTRLHIITEQGELVETLDHSAGLPASIQRIGISTENRVILDDGAQYFDADMELLNWSARNSSIPVDWSRVRAMSAERSRQLTALAPGAGPSWERILQDLHSGRLFGTAGIFFIDLTGVIILLLAVSGFVTIIMRKRRNSKQHPV